MKSTALTKRKLKPIELNALLIIGVSFVIFSCVSWFLMWNKNLTILK